MNVIYGVVCTSALIYLQFQNVRPCQVIPNFVPVIMIIKVSNGNDLKDVDVYLQSLSISHGPSKRNTVDRDGFYVRDVCVRNFMMRCVVLTNFSSGN